MHQICRFHEQGTSLLPVLLLCLVCSMTEYCHKCSAREPDTGVVAPNEREVLPEVSGDSEATVSQPGGTHVRHPDGPGKWTEWGISPRTLTRQERLKQRAIIDTLIGANSTDRDDVLLQIAGRKRIDKAQQIFEILGMHSLPTDKKGGWALMRISGDQFRTVSGFKSQGLNERLLWTPDGRCRLAFKCLKTGERVYVRLVCASSAAEALAAYITTHAAESSATIGATLPTCRINSGPGEFCWLSWNRTNEDGTVCFPFDADILFIRDGVAVFLFAMDAAKHESVMDLAKKLDAILVATAKNAERDASSMERDSQ